MGVGRSVGCLRCVRFVIPSGALRVVAIELYSNLNCSRDLLLALKE